MSALGHEDRLGIVLWLLDHGPARQVEILEAVQRDRRRSINPGTITALLKPLLDSGVLVRDRPREPISVSDPERIVELLQSAALVATKQADTGKRRADSRFKTLRRKLVREADDSRTDLGAPG